MISENASFTKIQEAALRGGMVPLKASGISKVAEHLTSIDEIVRLID